MDCAICGNEFEYEDTYGEAKCPHCGQRYEYEEGQQLNLTENQVAILRNIKKADVTCNNGSDDMVKIRGKILFKFPSFQNWINSAQRKFGMIDLNRNQYICVDTQGNALVKGLEFQRAKENDWFPVTVYQVII